MLPSRFVNNPALLLLCTAALWGCEGGSQAAGPMGDDGGLSQDDDPITHDGGLSTGNDDPDANVMMGQPCDEPLAVRTRFAQSMVPYGETCLGEVQTSSCIDGVWGEWSGTHMAERCSVALPAACEGAPHGSVEARISYAEARVAFDAHCRQESQTRRCDNGTWTPWTGTYAEANCQPEVPAACDGQPHGSVEARIRYAASEVGPGESCSSEAQTRRCHDGTWTPWTGTLEETTCASNGKACEGGSHGEVQARVRYAEAYVAFGAQCAAESQTRRCDDGAWTPWTGGFKESACASEPGASCDGTPHGGQIARVRYAQAAPVQGGQCEPEVQTRSCVNGLWRDWTGSYQHGLCGAQARADSCDTTPNGGVETRVRYAEARVSGSEKCSYEVQLRECKAGTFSAWTGSFAELGCVAEHASDACAAGYDACGICGGPGPKRMYADADGDGFGDPAAEHLVCPTTDTTGLVQNSTDLTPKCFTRRGNVKLEEQTDILAMQGVCEIEGDLELSVDDSITTISLPSLTRVTGKVAQPRCDSFTCPTNLNLQSVDFPSLREASGVIFRGRKSLHTIKMPALEKVAGELLLGDCRGGVCYGSPALSRVDFSALTEVTDRLSLSYLPTSFDPAFPRLARVGKLEFEYCSLKRVGMFWSLKSADEIYISGSGVTSIEFRALEQVGRLSLHKLESITTLSFPALKQMSSLSLGDLGLKRFSCWDAFPVLSSVELSSLYLHAGPKTERMECYPVAKANEVYLSGEAVEFSLSSLTEADKVTVRANQGVSLYVHNLSRVGELSITAPHVYVMASRLETVSNRFSLDGPNGTSDVQFEKLAEVLGDLSLTSGGTRLDMPALRQVKGMLNIEMPAAKSVILGGLTHVDAGLNLGGASALTELNLTKLARVGGSLRVESSQLTQLSLPVLGDIGWDFDVRSNPVLASVQVPALQHAGGMVVLRNNPALPACVATGLATRLGVSCSCGSNGPGTCEP